MVHMLNWLDLAILFLLGISILLGWRTGLFNAAFLAGGAAAGVFVAGHISDDVSELLTDSLFSDTLATVIAYAAITTVVFVTVQALRGVIGEAAPNGMMKAISVQWMDNLGGGRPWHRAGACAYGRSNRHDGKTGQRPAKGVRGG